MEESNILKKIKEKTDDLRYFPNLIKSGTRDGYNFLILDYLESSLVEYLDENNRSIESINIVVRGMIDSVKAMHKIGLLHRDIKPQNFRITRN